MTEKPKRKKYWILGLALATCLVCLLLVLTSTPTLGPHKPGPSGETKYLIQALHLATVAYVIDRGTLPKNLNNHDLTAVLMGGNPEKQVIMEFESNDVSSYGEIIDGWGTPFRISYASQDEISIISAGPDKTFETSDDIVVKFNPIDDVARK